jgi:DNA-binding XRE family transcriptional regulator
MKRVLKKSELVFMGRRVCEMRRAAGLTMKQLAKEALVAEWTVRHVERGDFKLLAGYMRCVAAFGIQMRHILNAKEETWREFLERVDGAKVAREAEKPHRR